MTSVQSKLPTGDIQDGATLLTLGTTVYGSLEQAGDRDIYTFVVPANIATPISVTVIGIGDQPLPAATLYFVLNGEALGGGSSLFPNFTSSTQSFGPSLVYTIEVEAEDGQSTGDFILTVEPHTFGSLTLGSTEVAWQLVQNYANWSNATLGTDIQPWRAMDLSSGVLTYDVSGLTPEAAALAVTALQMWNDILGQTLVEVTDGQADLVFDDDILGLEGVTELTLSPDGKVIEGALVKVPQELLQSYGSGYDSPAYEAYLHEIGHALGLGHAGNYTETAEASAKFYANDSAQMTVMSRLQSFDDDFSGANTNDEYPVLMRHVLTPMAADVVAMELLYGKVSTARTGDTTYGYNADTGSAFLDHLVDLAAGGTIGFTIVDGGGHDTLDLSGYAGGQVISLRPDDVSNVLGGLRNMNIAAGTWIEDAIGGAGDDVIGGNLLDNRLEGGAGDDRLSGRKGDDTLIGGAGHDRLFGDEGNDLLVLDGAEGFDDAYGGAGWDRVEIASDANLVIDLVHGAYKPAGGRFALVGIEEIAMTGTGRVTVQGGSGDDIVSTGSGDDRLYGGAGGDWLDGGAGRDFLFGGEGDDALAGGPGADVMDGGSGNDVYLVDDSRDRVIDSSTEDGFDVILTTVSYKLAADARIEALTALEPGGLAPLILQGNDWGQWILGNHGDNLLRGNGGADLLQGLDGNDTLISGIGGAEMEGGAGDDLYRVLDAADLIHEDAGEGFDTVIAAVSFVLTAGAEVEDLRLANPGRVTARELTGNDHAQSLRGDAGANLLTGGGGADTIFGLAGDDTLTGGAGGGSVLIGGAGADVFILRTDGADLIRDFGAQDRLWVELGLGTSQAPEGLRVNTSGLAEAAGDRLIYDSASGRLWYDADGLGGQDGLLLATLRGAPALTEAQILLI